MLCSLNWLEKNEKDIVDKWMGFICCMKFGCVFSVCELSSLVDNVQVVKEYFLIISRSYIVISCLWEVTDGVTSLRFCSIKATFKEEILEEVNLSALAVFVKTYRIKVLTN